MIVARLACSNIKRIWRDKPLRLLLIALPLVCALCRAAFAGNLVLLRAAQTCPFACAVILCVLLDRQWSVDRARGLAAGLLSSPVSRRAIIASRAISGALILLAQMTVFGGILLLRF